MHELSTMVRLVNQAADIAKKNHAASVAKIIVQVGEMTDIVPEYLQKYYPEATRNTVLEGSELQTEVISTKVTCTDCQNVYHPSKEYDYRCPKCGSLHATVLQGRSVILKQIIIED